MTRRNRSFIYPFDQLPLCVDPAARGGWVSGEAEIFYTDDLWDFTVGDIWLDGEDVYTKEQKVIAYLMGDVLPKPATKRMVPSIVLEQIIRNALQKHVVDDVQESIRQEIEEQRIYARDDAADHKRDQMMEMGR